MWKTLPRTDKRFIDTLVVLAQILEDDRLHYEPLPPDLERMLEEADRNVLFSVVAECLGYLLNASTMDRIKHCRPQCRSASAACGG